MFNLTSRLESKSSSKIENIVTTMGTRFKHYDLLQSDWTLS
ncbi:hypothetical protein [Vibrio lentus]